MFYVTLIITLRIINYKYTHYPPTNSIFNTQ